MKRVFEGAVLKPQQNSAFLRLPSFDFGNSRYSPSQFLQNGSEYLTMFIMKIFNHERKVFAFTRKVLCITYFLLMTRLVNVKIRYMPSLEKLSQGHDSRKSLELRKSLDGK